MFPFPSNGKALSDEETEVETEREESFNSLQTGKSFRTKIKSRVGGGSRVSIPFKRESPFGLCIRIAESGLRGFPFPSNGKALSDPFNND